LLDYSDEPNNVLLVSDRTLYILNNLSLVDVHNLGRYYLEKFPSGYASFVDELDTEAEDIMDVANNVGLELFPVSDIRPVGSFTMLRGSGTQTIPNATHTDVTWTTFTTPPADILAFTGSFPIEILRPGPTLITASVIWTGNATGYRYFSVWINGENEFYLQQYPPNAVSYRQDLAMQFQANPGDEIALRVYQTSGANLDLIVTAAQYAASMTVTGF
jgi:hypothetical protein